MKYFQKFSHECPFNIIEYLIHAQLYCLLLRRLTRLLNNFTALVFITHKTFTASIIDGFNILLEYIKRFRPFHLVLFRVKSEKKKLHLNTATTF